MKNIDNKKISKVIFLIVVFILMIRIIYASFLENIVVEEKAIKVYEVSQEDIISSGDEILIKSFKDNINNVKWIDTDKLSINGTIDGKENKYLFDMNEKELKIYESNIDYNKDYSPYEFIINIPNYGDLCSLDSQIGLLNEDEFYTIAENTSYNSELQYVVSDNLEKMAYYQNDMNRIITYSFSKDFYRTVLNDTDESLLNNFKNNVKISPDGGYVSFEIRDEDFKKSRFSIVGADSGKVYIKDVLGVELSWAFDDSKVSYYYSEETESIESTYNDYINISSNRIGYYDIESKKIGFAGSSKSEKNMISDLFWSSDNQRISSLTGEYNDGILSINGVSEFDFKENKFKQTSFETKIVKESSKIDLIDHNDSYILFIDSAEGYSVDLINKNDGSIEKFENLEKINLNDEEFVYYYKDVDTLVTAENDLIIINKPTYTGYIHLENLDYVLYPSYNSKYLAVWFKDSNQIKILTTE